MKVYCRTCYWYMEPGYCKNPILNPPHDTPKDIRKGLGRCAIHNKNNDCSEYQEAGMCRILLNHVLIGW